MINAKSPMVSALLAGLVVVWVGERPAAAQDVALGTGEAGSVYHQLGRSICRLVDAGSDDHGVTCQPLATPLAKALPPVTRSGTFTTQLPAMMWGRLKPSGP